MAESWGNGNAQKHDEDLVSNPNYHNILKVNDVNEDDDDKIALHTINSSTDDDARALKAEGMAEVTRLIVNTRADMGGIIVLTNPGSINMDGVLDISGDITTDPDTRPVVKINDVHDGDHSGDNKIALHTKNSSTEANARALKAEGTSELAGNVGIGGDLLVANGGDVKLDGGGNMLLEDGGNLTLDSGDLTLETGDIVIESGTLRTEAGHGANVQINDVNNGESHKVGIYVKNSDNNAAARAMKVEGHAEIIGNSTNNPDTTALKATNVSTHADARALVVEGTAEVEGLNLGPMTETIGLMVTNESTANTSRAIKVIGKVEIDDRVMLGDSNTDGFIDAASVNHDLNIGTGVIETNNVVIGRTGKEVDVKGRLDAEENIRVGDANDDGLIDAADDARDLKIGTQADFTADVEIGRSGRKAVVRSDLKVGPADMTGKIESGGTGVAPQDLKIGVSGETNGITLGRAGVTVDVQCQTRVNSNAVIMNGAASLLDANGCGQVFNAVGHPGPNMPCIDFYINGAVVGYIDANGWNNA